MARLAPAPQPKCHGGKGHGSSKGGEALAAAPAPLVRRSRQASAVLAPVGWHQGCGRRDRGFRGAVGRVGRGVGSSARDFRFFSLLRRVPFDRDEVQAYGAVERPTPAHSARIKARENHWRVGAQRIAQLGLTRSAQGPAARAQGPAARCVCAPSFPLQPLLWMVPPRALHTPGGSCGNARARASCRAGDHGCGGEGARPRKSAPASNTETFFFFFFF